MSAPLVARTLPPDVTSRFTTSPWSPRTCSRMIRFSLCGHTHWRSTRPVQAQVWFACMQVHHHTMQMQSRSAHRILERRAPKAINGVGLCAGVMQQPVHHRIAALCRRQVPASRRRVHRNMLGCWHNYVNCPWSAAGLQCHSAMQLALGSDQEPGLLTAGFSCRSRSRCDRPR